MQSTELFITLFNSIFFHGDTPLHVAAYYNKLDICEVLIKKGAAINATNRQEDTPLHNAAVKSNIDIIKLLIENGAHVDQQNKFGNTPLHESARYKADAVKLLIEYGANT